MRTTKKAPAGRRGRQICSGCGTENPSNSRKCTKCGKSRFEPSWVVAKRPVNRQLSVQITTSNPAYGDATDRITLSKWWPGGRATFHIPNPAQWERIATIIESDLAPILGWSTSRELAKRVRDRQTSDREQKKNLQEIATQHPDFLKEVVAAIDPKKLGKSDISALLETFGEIADAFTNANAGFREAFLSVVKKLPKQKQRALEDLALLLQGWSLHVITNVAQQVRSRIETIELFEKQVNDSRTFEISGDDSIHRILERAMWLVDERYWLLYSNKTLRKSIGDEMSKQDRKRFGDKRPDFVCGTVGDRLIILELKRPSHTLSVDDLNQLETYVTIAEKYSSFKSCSAYLVGKKADDEVSRRLKYRSGTFKVLTYTDLLDYTKQRYHEFLKSIEGKST
jgi:ribosomal protein L40E